MTSWEQELCTAVVNDDLASVKAILARDVVKRNGNVGRNEWGQAEVTVYTSRPYDDLYSYYVAQHRVQNKRGSTNCRGQHNYQTDMMAAPLHCAVQLGRNEMIQAMADADFDIDSYLKMPDGCRVTCLHLAALANPATVKLLLDLGADSSLNGTYMGHSGTAKEFAQRSGRQDLIKALDDNIDIGSKFVQTMAAKIGSLSTKEEKLAKAETVREKIDNKEKELRTLEIKKSNIVDGIAALKADQNYMSNLKMKQLRRELDEIKGLVAAFQKVATTTTKTTVPKEESTAKLCSVCFEAPRQVFSCLECDNWVCGNCKNQLSSCPTCRQDLKVKPMRRSVAIEKLLASM